MLNITGDNLLACNRTWAGLTRPEIDEMPLGLAMFDNEKGRACPTIGSVAILTTSVVKEALLTDPKSRN